MNKKAFALLAVIIAASTFAMLPLAKATQYTFGYTTIGSLTTPGTGQRKYASRFQMGTQSGTLDSIDAVIYAQSGTIPVKAVIYADSSGSPSSLLGASSEIQADATKSFKHFTGFGAVWLEANAYYWLGWHTNGGYNYAYTNGQSTKYNDDPYSNGPSNPFGSASTVSKIMSVYATYSVGGADTYPPTYSNVGTNSTVAGQPCKFYAKWADNVGLDGYIFGTNNTSTWQNTTLTTWSGAPTSAWSNVTRTLNSVVGKVIAYRFWAKDTSNNWADTGLKYVTTTQNPTEIYNPVKAVVIRNNYEYQEMPGGSYNDSYTIYEADAVVWGMLQQAGIPYDVRYASEMANVSKLKEYSLIAFPRYLASNLNLQPNLVEAVVTAVNDGVGIWTVGYAGGYGFIETVHNVLPNGVEERFRNTLRVNSTYLISDHYSTGDLIGSSPYLSEQDISEVGRYDSSRPYYEIVSTYKNGSIYKGGAVVASTLGNGRTVWITEDATVFQAQGILIRLLRWASKSPVFLELEDSPATGVNLQIRIDGDVISLYPNEYKQFMWKIGNVTQSKVSLYIVTDFFTPDQYAMAAQYPKNEYGSHSKTHGPMLTDISLAQGILEFNGSKTTIQTNLGWPITGFAYPYNAFNKTTTSWAGAYDYQYIGCEFNLSIVYPSSVWLSTPPDPKTNGVNTYTLVMTVNDDYTLFWARHYTSAAVLQNWKNNYDWYAKQAAVAESNVNMNLLWHIKEMAPSAVGLNTYFNYIDWVANNKSGTFRLASELVRDVKELEGVDLQYRSSSDVINVTLTGSLSQGHPLRLFNLQDVIHSVTVDGQDWTNFRDKVVVLPALGQGVHHIQIRKGPPAKSTIHGTVTDSGTGNPLGGVQVTCGGASTVTAANGSYSFTLTSAVYAMTFTKTGYITETRNVDAHVPGDYTVNVAMTRQTATIRGTVTDFDTGNPLAAVGVTCDGQSTSTASNGSYSFTVYTGLYTLTFTKAGYHTETRNVNASVQGTYVINVVMRPLTAIIRGTVTDSSSGNPLVGVKVTADGKYTFTAVDGTYSLNVTLGSYTLTFEKTGYFSAIRTQDCPTVGEYVLNVSLQPRARPTNYELVIQDMDQYNRLIAMHNFYHFSAKAYDEEGDIRTIKIAFTDGVTWANFSFTLSDQTFSRLSGYEIAELNATDSSFVTGGNWLNVTFSIRIKYVADEASNIELYQWSDDSLGNTNGWQTMQTDYADIVKANVSNPLESAGMGLTFVGSVATAVGLGLFYVKKKRSKNAEQSQE